MREHHYKVNFVSFPAYFWTKKEAAHAAPAFKEKYMEKNR